MGMALYKPNNCPLPQAKRSSLGLPKLPKQEQLLKLQEQHRLNENAEQVKNSRSLFINHKLFYFSLWKALCQLNSMQCFRLHFTNSLQFFLLKPLKISKCHLRNSNFFQFSSFNDKITRYSICSIIQIIKQNAGWSSIGYNQLTYSRTHSHIVISLISHASQVVVC